MDTVILKLNDLYRQANITFVQNPRCELPANKTRALNQGYEKDDPPSRINGSLDLIRTPTSADIAANTEHHQLLQSSLFDSEIGGKLNLVFVKALKNHTPGETDPGGLARRGGNVALVDATSTTINRDLIYGHEIGHLLGLSVKNGRFAEAHDFAPLPPGYPGSLMSRLAEGRWLRHEDWETANEAARLLGP